MKYKFKIGQLVQFTGLAEIEYFIPKRKTDILDINKFATSHFSYDTDSINIFVITNCFAATKVHCKPVDDEILTNAENVYSVVLQGRSNSEYYVYEDQIEIL